MSRCSNCGAPHEAFAKFCPHCGQPIVNALDSPAGDDSHPFLTLIGNVIGGSLAIIVGLVQLILSIALPVLVIMAIISGPSKTWDRITAWVPGGDEPSGVCRGFDDWTNGAQDRFMDWQTGIEEFGVITLWSSQDAQIVIDDTNDLIAYMKDSNPPQEAQKLNDMYIEFLELTNVLAEAQHEGDNSTLLLQRGELQPKMEEIMIEHDRVAQLCD